MLKRLDAFQMRGTRYILKIEHSYYSHFSNKEVYDKGNIILNGGTDLNVTWAEFIGAGQYADAKQITLLSDYIMKQQNKLFAHIARDEHDTEYKRKPTFDENLMQPERPYKRVGQPRISWVKENHKYGYEKTQTQNY